MDNGADEYDIPHPPEDSAVLMELFGRSDVLYFDMERKVLIFSSISLGG